MSSSQEPPQRFRSLSPSAAYSPASSPSFGPCDSSPPSSPHAHDRSPSPPASPGLAHPFAASTKGVRPPRIYERHERRISDNDISFQLDLLDPDASPARAGHATNIPVHPLAGSANAAWTPPEWEKKPSRRRVRTFSSTSMSSSGTFEPEHLFSTPSQRFPESDGDYDAINLSDDEDAWSVRKSRRQQEQEMWDKAITTAIDKADGIIDLM
jgi:hypothetical protein